MELTIASPAKLAPGKMTSFETDGKSILVANVGGKFYAIGNICTHMGCRLSEGTLTGEKVQCPCHGSIFDVTNGQVVKGPAKNAEPSFKVRVEGDKVLATM